MNSVSFKANKCDYCGRQISVPHVIPGLGKFGPECVQKLSQLERWLERHGVEGLIGNGLTVGMGEAPAVYGKLNYVFATLRKNGINVFSEKIGDSLHVRLDGVTPRRFKASLARGRWMA